VISFDEHYYDEIVVDIPLNFDLMRFNEEGQIEMDIEEKYVPELIKCGFLKKSVKEATLGKMKKGIVKVTDPETGKETDFEASVGNAKIGGETIVINMSTAKQCMSAIIGTCVLGAQGKCYSLKDFQRFPKKKERDIRQQKQWACLTPEAIAEGLNKVAKQFGNVQFVRVNDAGEIRNLPTDPAKLANVPDKLKADLADVDDVSKLKKIGEELKKLGSNLILYTYTHRSDLDIGDLGSNVCVNGSGYMLDNAYIPLELDEYIDTMDLVKKGELKEFNGVPVTKAVSCSGDCRTCQFCKTKDGKHIFLAIHGAGTKLYVALKRITNAVAKHPNFGKILMDDSKSVEERAKAMYKLLTPEDKKIIDYVKPKPVDRYKFFELIIKNKENANRLVDAIIQYVSAEGGEKTVLISNKMSDEGLAKSVDSLMGYFKDEMERANKMGQKTAAEKKWPDLIKTVQKAIDDAKAGKKPKPSVAAGKQFAGLLKRTK